MTTKSRTPAAETLHPTIEIGLTAAIVAVEGEEPQSLIAGDSARQDGLAALPFGPFDPLAHRTFEIGLRAWVEAQTGLRVGYVEQLYTFGDRGRHSRPGDTGTHMVSIGYLALTRRADKEEALNATGAHFAHWYRFFPWEDWRERRPRILDDTILPLLGEWAGHSQRAEPGRALSRRARLRLCFGLDDAPWDEEKVLDRYELLYEAGLVEEALRDGREAALARKSLPALGAPLRFDHRRVLATAIARLRAKLKYRPVVFELMPDEFTLTALQHTVEGISGRRLHKQNFRRLVEQSALVEPTGTTSTATGGRPAAVYRFRREVSQERPAPGLRLGARA
ncbi:MAG: NAD regulator [Rhizobiales bacterium]|nr:NAD regulator [Hyphomicrobiales bacterium]